MDYYLKGSLLFTYTLAYAEVILILIIVIVNMFTILQNVYRESRRETTIVRMIGGTNLYTLFVVFIRIGLIASVASFLGYGIGASILRLLARANQTVFFGHTFTPTGSVGIFFLNVVLMIFVAIISSLLIARRVRQEKSIVYTRRQR
ncbi:MAG: ABC transporter permease, partial [Candidatus Heimdallarchaeota archaeon]|nr:ABC transporter permease [Candidatus Heimdallarchaeota archaeon]MCK4955693.1 ABC transporter permease [Candidatus Heimdallarchaeota archaeon]